MQHALSYTLQSPNREDGAADRLYARARRQGCRSQLKTILKGKSRGLLALGDVSSACSVQTQSDSGVRAVSISQIRGSESRSGDFDCDFNPLQGHTKSRWLSIAVARGQGKTLPPVRLTQVGDVYYVRDGHHRISVARALGQTEIEAHVVVWQVDGLLPSEIRVRAASPGIRAQVNKPHGGATRLQERARLSVQALLGAANLA
jgi:hypothetical protein